jgi:HSP20 family molecular chaperone IbpA
MSSEQVVRIPVRVGETITDEIQEMYDEIIRRAYEIFQRRGGNCTLDLEDWLTAEQQVLEKPNVRVDETSSRIVVRVYVTNPAVMDVQLLVTPHAMLVHGPIRNTSKKLFRVVQFPRKIDVTKAEAQYGEGCLVLTA